MNMEEGRRWGHNALLLSESAHQAWSWIENSAHGHYMRQQGSFSWGAGETLLGNLTLYICVYTSPGNAG